MRTITLDTARAVLSIAAVILVTRVPLAAQQHDDSPWELSIGAGVALSPRYEGADDMRVSPVPMVRLVWNDRIYLTIPEELGVTLYNNRNIEANIGIGYDFGRDDDDALSGLGDIDRAPTVNFGIEYEVGPITTGLSAKRYVGGSDGVEASLEVGGRIPLGRPADQNGPRPAIAPAVAVSWADDRYMSSYFGVDAEQATRSGLERHDAEAGFKSLGGSIALMYPLSARFFATASFEYSRLIGDAADSPIVRNENQYVTALLVMYRF